MKLDQIFHGESLKASDLQGKEVRLTITGWALKELDDGNKPELRFAETERTLIVNKTNAMAILDETGLDDLDEWKGVQIVLYATKTDYAGKRVDCIRIRSARRPKSVEAPPEKYSEVDENRVPF